MYPSFLRSPLLVVYEMVVSGDSDGAIVVVVVVAVVVS